MFVFLFVYMVFSAVLYKTTDHITSYQVISGPLSRNEIYTGLVLHEERTVAAELGGYISYYAREGSKINANGTVYGLSSTQSADTDITLSKEDLNRIRNQMSSFSGSFSSSNFNATYGFKYELEGNILQYAGTDSNDGSTTTIGGQTLCKASSDGIILYSKDGYEGKTIETLTSADFNKTSYHETDLKTSGQVYPGNDIYTIITDEQWDLIIPLTDKQAVKLADRTSIRVKFLKDGMTQSGDFQLITIEDQKYGRLTFDKGLIRYASDRFLEIELVTNSQTGLKIPLSSIVAKDFYLIPSEYLAEDQDSGQFGFLKYSTDDGKEINTFVPVTIYGQLQKAEELAPGQQPTYYYYIGKEIFDTGDILSKPDSGEHYTIGETRRLDGVYCINKGYAVFRCISILEQNEEFAIVDEDTAYGLVRYDHIVQDSSKVNEEDILY
ncbi:MAG: HlyD family efflux transporter periplasmic adaptor subunit [Eubacteriales bacterium]|nr:HlyD family efflux transporter periplasmic adaptor subunit [Eubacteriales bacterium]